MSDSIWGDLSVIYLAYKVRLIEQSTKCTSITHPSLPSAPSHLLDLLDSCHARIRMPRSLCGQNECRLQGSFCSKPTNRPTTNAWKLPAHWTYERLRSQAIISQKVTTLLSRELESKSLTFTIQCCVARGTVGGL